MKTIRYFRTLAILLITMLCLSLSGCKKGEGEGGDEAETAQDAQNAGENGQENEQGANAQADNTPPFQFEGAGGASGGGSSGNDEYAGLTSEEVLNAPIGPTTTPDSVTANIPAGIEVERTGQNTPSTPSDSTSPGTSSEPAATATGITVTPQTLYLTVGGRAGTTPSNNSSTTSSSTTGSSTTGSTTANSTTAAPSGGTTSNSAGSAQVTANLIGGTGQVDWRSDDTRIAQVSGSGNTATVTAVGPGSTYVTATIRGTNMSATVLVNVQGSTPQFFDVAPCLINKGGSYSAEECDKIIAAVNQARAEYGIPACTKNTGLCKVADVRSKEISYAYMNVRPDGSPYTSVAPAYYISESIAAIPKGSPGTAAVEGFKSYTTTRRDLMNENLKNIGASYYTWGDYTYVVVSMGY